MKLLILFIACFYLSVGQASNLKIINYNVWHGLNGTGLWKFGELESPERRELRTLTQIEEFKKADADLIFLQEVNPVYRLAKRFADALNMDYVMQTDQCGIKVLRVGPPFNLHTGLAILAKKSLKLEKLKGVKLSGSSFGFCGEWFGLQLKEFRYALIARVFLNQQPVTLVNVHLHHGPAPQAHFVQFLDEMVESQELSSTQRETILQAMEDAEKRRLEELDELKTNLEPYKGFPAILAGDLNQIPGSPTANRAMSLLPDGHGVYENLDEQENFYTWNPQVNHENFEITSGLASSIPYFGNQKVQKALNELDRMERQIDYVLWYGGVEKSWELVSRPTLFAHTPGSQGIMGSDHFGIAVELKLADE